MKTFLSILILANCISCTQNETKVQVSNSKAITETLVLEEQIKQSEDKLVGTWYVKEILIKGKPNLDEYPVNNDELTFNSDGSMVTIDKTFNTEDKGTWQWINDNQFALILEDERVVFEILKLTESEMETKMLTYDLDMLIKYSKEK